MILIASLWADAVEICIRQLTRRHRQHAVIAQWPDVTKSQFDAVHGANSHYNRDYSKSNSTWMKKVAVEEKLNPKIEKWLWSGSKQIFYVSWWLIKFTTFLVNNTISLGKIVRWLKHLFLQSGAWWMLEGDLNLNQLCIFTLLEPANATWKMRWHEILPLGASLECCLMPAKMQAVSGWK